MNVPSTNEEQKQTSPHEVEGKTVVPALASPDGSTATATTSKPAGGHRESARQVTAVSTDKYAEKRLARKKKMRAAHRRRLKASYAKG